MADKKKCEKCGSGYSSGAVGVGLAGQHIICAACQTKWWAIRDLVVKDAFSDWLKE